MTPPAAKAGDLRRPTLVRAGGASAHLFRIASHAGIWRVIHNGAFYRDYTTEADALDGALAAARKEQDRGHAARIVTPAGDVPPTLAE